MNIRRMLAFILTIAMLMGNVVPAYATEAGNNGVTVVDDGNVKTTELNQEQEKEEVVEENVSEESDSTAPEKEEQGSSESGSDHKDSQGEDISTKEEGEDSQAGNDEESPSVDEESTSGDNEKDSSKEDLGDDSASTEEGDTSEGDNEKTPEDENAEGDSNKKEDPENKEEDETLEESEDEISDEDGLEEEEIEEEDENLEEDSLSDNSISVSSNSVETKLNDLGGRITLSNSEDTFDTLAEALEEATKATESVTIGLPENDEPEVYELFAGDLAIQNKNNITLNLNGNILYAKAKGSNKVFESNVSFGSGAPEEVASEIRLEKGVTFKIKEKSRQVSEPTFSVQMYNIKFTSDTAASNAETIQIGHNTQDASKEDILVKVLLSKVTFEGIDNIQIYDSCDIQSAINTGNLTIDLDTYSEEDESVSLADVNVANLSIKGNVAWSNDKANHVISSESTKITTTEDFIFTTLYGTYEFHNLKVEGTGSLNFLSRTYNQGGKEVSTNLQFSGTVTTNGKPIQISDGSKNKFAEGEIIATIPEGNPAGAITASMFCTEGMVVVLQGNQLIAKGEQFRVTYTQYNENGTPPEYVTYGTYADVSTMLQDMKRNSKNEYQVHVLQSKTLADDEHWNFSGLHVELIFVNDVKISVAPKATAFITVDKLNGSGASKDGGLRVNQGAELNIRGDVYGATKDIKLDVFQVKVVTDTDASFVLGTQGNGPIQQVQLRECDLSDCKTLKLHNVTLQTDQCSGWNGLNLELYGNVNWNSMLRAEGYGNEIAGRPMTLTPENCAISIDSLKVENESPKGAFIGHGITANTLDLHGNLNSDTLTVGNTYLTAGSFLCTTDIMTLNNITLRSKENEKSVTLATQDIYKLDSKVHSGRITLSGKLTGAGDVILTFDKNAMNVVKSTNSMKYEIKSPYTKGANIASGDVLATLLPAQQEKELASHLNYTVSRDGMIASVEETGGTYQVKAVDKSSGIFVYEVNSGQYQSFTTWADVKSYIVDNFKEAANAKIEITVNAGSTLDDSTALDYSELSKTTVKLNLNGYEVKLLNGQVVAVDEIYGYKGSTKGKLTLNKNNTIRPRNTELKVEGVTLKQNTTSLVLGNDQKEKALKESNIILLDTGSTSMSKLTVYGKVTWLDTVTASNLDLLSVSLPEDKVQPGNLHTTGLTVSNMLTAESGNILTVEPAGKLSLKNITLNQGQGDSLYIQLQRVVTLSSKDAGKETDPDFVDAKTEKGIGTVTISGTITNDAKASYPVTFEKINRWSYNGAEQYKADNFGNREKLATVNIANANDFMILSYQKNLDGTFKKNQSDARVLDTDACTRKEGTALQAAYRILTVTAVDMAGKEVSRDYACLEDAVANISKEFLDTNKKTINGTYTFTFLGNTAMTKAQTLPSCVKEAIFTTRGNEESGYQECSLNIQTFNLTTSGSLVLQGGLKIEGTLGARTTPKLSVGKDLTINIYKLINQETSNEKEYVPVENIAVEVTKGTLFLNAKDAQFLGNLNGNVTAKNLKAEGGGNLRIHNLTLKSGDASFRNTQTVIPSITMEKSKFYLGEGVCAELGNLLVKSVYGMESMGDATIELAAGAELSAETVNLPAGTFAAGKNAVVNVDTITKVKDIILGEGAKLTTNYLTQISGAKNYLEKDSVLFINDQGTLETIVMGGKEGREGTIYLGVGHTSVRTEKDGKVTEEIIPAPLTINKVPTRTTEDLVIKFFVDDKDTPLTLEENTTIFSVPKAINNFPLDYVDVMQQEKDGENYNIYQSGTAIKVIGNYINLWVLQAGALQTQEDKYTKLRSFSSWADTMNYLTAHGNTATTYKMEINEDTIVVGGKITLPKTVGKLIIVGNVKDTATYIDFTGDITLTTNTEFRKVSFTDEEHYVATGVHGIAVGDKELVLDGINSIFKSLTGTKNAKVIIKNSDVKVPNKIQTIGTMEFENSVFYVKGKKDVTVGRIVMENSGLWIDGKLTITDLVSNSEGNRIAARDIVINGTVTGNNTDDVKAVAKKENDKVTHYIFGKNVTATGETDVYSVKQNAIFLTKLDGVGDKRLIPAEDTLLVTAAKVPASWFVVAQNSEQTHLLENISKTKVSATPEVWEYKTFNLTNKADKKINVGAVPVKKVVLADKATGIALDSFKTLQEALNEIAAISDAKGQYIITLYGDDTNTADYKITEKKAESIEICAADNVETKFEEEDFKNGKVELFYKKDLDLKTNVTLKNITLYPSSDGTLKLNKYAIILDNTSFASDRKIAVTDSNAAASLTLQNYTQDVNFVSIKQSGSLELKHVNILVSGELKAGTLALTEAKATVLGKTTLNKWVVNSSNSVLRGENQITIKDISLNYGINDGGNHAVLETVAIPTWGKTAEDANKITALKTQLTISGKLEKQSANEKLEVCVTSRDLYDNVMVPAEVVDGDNKITISAMDVMIGTLTEEIRANGFVLAKASNISTSDIVVERDIYSVIKKNGELLCKNTESYVTLQYNDGSSVLTSAFETFTDAVKEIDTLKVKRDYKVIFDGNGKADGYEYSKGNKIPASAIMNLTMPKAANVKSLTLEGCVYYTGGITFTSDVILENVHFVQVTNTAADKTQSANYRPVDEIEINKVVVPAAVKVNNGGYTLSVASGKQAKFNTPIELTGNKKGTLDLSGTGRLFAGANITTYGYDTANLGNVEYHQDTTLNMEATVSNLEGSLIQGSVKGFALVKVNADSNNIQIIGYPSYNAKTGVVEYKSTALETSTLNINQTPQLLVGYNSNQKTSQIERKDNVTIKDLYINGGNLKVMGEANFTNVTLTGSQPKVTVLGQIFNINGNLTSTTDSSELRTTYDKDYNSVLIVKGDVVLENTENHRIAVCVADAAGKGISVGRETDGIHYGNRLLSAAKAKVKDFKPSVDSLHQGDKEYGTGEDKFEGYLLKKNGNYIEVMLDGRDAAGCALYLEDGTAEGTLINYYPIVNDAVKEIDSRKDKTKEYTIKLYADHGKKEVIDGQDMITYAELKMPKEAKKVTLESHVANNARLSEGGEGRLLPSERKAVIYFNKDISLGCNTEFKDLEFVSSVKDGKATASLKAGKFEFGFENCSVNVKDISSTGIMNLNAGSEITVDGKAALQDIKLFGTAAVHNKVRYTADNAKNITIKGNIHKEGSAEPLYLDILGTVKSPDVASHKIVAEKVANIEKASFDSFDVYDDSVRGNQSQAAQNVYNKDKGLSVAWDSKALYRMVNGYVYDKTEGGTYSSVVEVTDESGNRVVCLDFNEAAEYIKNVGNLNKTFTITMLTDVLDTNVTDSGQAYSKWTLPAKDKAAKVIVEGGNKTLRFKDHITTNGSVTIQNVTLLNPDKDFDINNNKNSKVLISGVNPGEVTLKNVAMGNNVTSISNIKGTAKVTVFTVINSNLQVKGNVTNLAELKLENATIKAHSEKAKANVSKFTVVGKGVWETYGATTVGDIVLRNLATGTEGKETPRKAIETYIGASRAKEGAKSNLAVTGKVSTVKGNGGEDETVSGAVVIKLYDLEDRHYLTEKDSKYTSYQGVKLLTAKTEAAEKFVAEEYAEANDKKEGYTFKAGIESYKDNTNQVMNGDITQMEVELTNTTGLRTYVSTYAEAISIINSIGDSTAHYSITLRGIDDKPGTTDIKEGNAEISEVKNEQGQLVKKTVYVIKTDGKNGTRSYGKLLLPSANKAASLTIKGETDKRVEIRYTGNIAPNCNLNLDNIHLSEGTVKNITVSGVKLQEFNNSGLVTLNLGNAQVTLGKYVTGGWESQDDRDDLIPSYYNGAKITFKSISGSEGTLELAKDQTIYVQGATTIPTLILQGENTSEYNLYTCGKVTLTDILGAGNLNLSVYHGTDVWKKGKTQLQIKGVADKEISINITPYIMNDKKLKTYEEISKEQKKELLISSASKPQAYQQIAVAPKLANGKTGDCGKVKLAGSWYLDKNNIQWGQEITPIKYQGGIYFTQEYYAVRVVGGKSLNTVLHDNNYEGEFFTWEDAVKEIDRLNQTEWVYDIMITKDLGTDKPLSSVPMPQKAKKVFLSSLNGIYGILTTTSNVTLKCETHFKNIIISGVQLKGGKYYTKEFTFDVGNNWFFANPMIQVHAYTGMGDYPCKMKLKGGSKGSANISVGDGEMNAVTAVSGIGELYLTAVTNSATPNLIFVPGGITNVGHFEVWGKVMCPNKDISVKNLYLKTDSDIKIKNLKVTGTATLRRSIIESGTVTVGDGKIILGDVVLYQTGNRLDGKVDKQGKSQIEIKGTISNFSPIYDYGATIALRRNNSTTQYVQLHEGMQLLKAPKATVSLFKPYYDDNTVKRMGPNDQDYGLYKKGNDILYGKVGDTPEARVWFGTEDTGEVKSESKSVDYMTLEEALKAIDTMGIQHTRTDTEGNKQVKYYENYTIELLKNVEIGNEKLDNNYKSISMPSKAGNLTIKGNSKEIRFSGNLTLKCNTKLSNVVLTPVKKVKNEAVASKANIAVGNYTLTVDNARCSDNGVTCIGNITGSSKSGKLVLMANNFWEANNITGLYAVEFIQNGDNKAESSITATGNLSVKDIIYSSGGTVSVGGNLTTNTLHVKGNVMAKIEHDVDKTMKINGTTITNPDKSKTTGSVFFENQNNKTITVYLKSSRGQEIPEGTQVIDGKYMSEKDWKFNIDGQEHKAYLRSNKLYVGSK